MSKTSEKYTYKQVEWGTVFYHRNGSTLFAISEVDNFDAAEICEHLNIAFLEGRVLELNKGNDVLRGLLKT